MTDVGLELVSADESGCVDAAVKKDVILRILFAGGPLCAIFIRRMTTIVRIGVEY